MIFREQFMKQSILIVLIIVFFNSIYGMNEAPERDASSSKLEHVSSIQESDSLLIKKLKLQRMQSEEGGDKKTTKQIVEIEHLKIEIEQLFHKLERRIYPKPNN